MNARTVALASLARRRLAALLVPVMIAVMMPLLMLAAPGPALASTARVEIALAHTPPPWPPVQPKQTPVCHGCVPLPR